MLALMLASSWVAGSASGQLTTIAPTLANWNRVSSGAWTETAEGLQVNGSGSRLPNAITSRDVYDLTGASVYIKWKPHGNANYMSAGPAINPFNVSAGPFTTHHSWAGSLVLTEDTWYYTRFQFTGNTTWAAVTCTGNYTDAGGTVFFTTSQPTGALASWVSSANLTLQFSDNYGGTGAYVVLGEAMTTGHKLDLIQVSQHGFEDDALAPNMTVQGTWAITTNAHNSAKALQLNVSTGDGFTLNLSNVARVSFDINHNCNSGISLGVDGAGGAGLPGAGADQWYHVDMAMPPSGNHELKLEVYSGTANGTYINDGKTIILDNLVLYSDGGPALTTGTANSITTTSATLNGTVNPNGFVTMAQFEYGLTTAYGSTASVTLSPNNGSTAQDVGANLSGLQAGTTYHYRLTAGNSQGTGAGGDATFTTVATGPPVITSQPVSRSNVISTTATFSVTATGAPPLSYQWRRNDTNLVDGANISGATTDTLSLAGVQLTDAGDYSVIVTNTLDSVPSVAATLTVVVDPLAAALDGPGLAWTSGGPIPWAGQATTTHDGIDAACSGAITHGQESWIQTDLTGPGMLTFWWKVSSESNYDYLEFYLDGVLQSGRISGTVDWQLKTYSVATGTHTARWRYMKDGSVNAGSDAGWVDQVSFVPDSAAPEIAVEQPAGSDLTDGNASVAFGNTDLGTNLPKTFTIKNLGATELSGLAVSKDGTNAADFAIGTLGATTLPPGASTTFNITFTPGAAGNRSAAIHVFSNDADENPFDIELSGTGNAFSPTSLSFPSIAGFSGNRMEPGLDPYIYDQVLAIDSANTFATSETTGNYTYVKTGPDTGTLIYTWNSEVEGYTYTESGTLLLIFGSEFAGTFTSSGSYSGVDSETVPFDGTFTGSGTFTIVPNNTVALPLALDSVSMTFTSGGDLGWSGQTGVTHDGVDAGQSGSIIDGQESWFETSVAGPGSLEFWWKVSSEADFDYLEFYVDDVLQDGGISGSVDWQMKTYSIPAQTHTLKWRYVKDNSVSNDVDAGWVDQVSFISDHAIPEIAVEQPTGTDLTNGSAMVSFGSGLVGGSSEPKAFTVRNTGTAPLTGLAVSLVGTGASDFSVNTSSLGTSIAPGASSSFTIVFSPSVAGTRLATIHLSNNDNDDNPFVFEVSGTGATPEGIAQRAYLKASNTGVEDYFGCSVAVSGNTVVIGAPYESSSSTGVGGNGNTNGALSSGAAYVFVRSGTSWAQQAYLKASNTGANDCFGTAVAVSGNTVVVGAPYEESSATGVDGNQGDNSVPSSGAAYVFVRAGTDWTQQAYLKAANTGAWDYFGMSVAISGDTAVVGAPYEDSSATGIDGNHSDDSATNAGAAYVFVRSGTAWTQQAYQKASNTGAWDYFGTSVAISGDTVVVGAPYEDSSATGIDGSGNNDSAWCSGAAYVYFRDAGTWIHQAYLKACNTDAWDYFGTSVAISDETVVIGAPCEGSATTTIDGEENDNTSPFSGAAYIYFRTGTTWRLQAYLKASNTGAEDFFGTAVAISGDTVLVGAPNEDSSSTGIDGDGTDNSAADSGAAYVFVRAGQMWTRQAYLKASNAGAQDYFGMYVAISGVSMVLGAPWESSSTTRIDGDESNNDAPSSGATYLFALVTSEPGITVEQPAGINLGNGISSVDFGNVGGTASRVFLVRNIGGANLSLLGLSMDGPNSSAFYADGDGLVTLAPGETTTFTIHFTPATVGTKSATLHISSNDASANPFDVLLVGVGSTASGAFALWANAAGLSGPDADHLASPHSDGVSNLLKFAFNLSGTGPDVMRLTEGTGTAGLPTIRPAGHGIIRFEFLRRTGSGLIYTPKISSTLAADSWTHLTDMPTVTPVAEGWERAVFEEPVDSGTSKVFGTVEVTLTE